MSDQTLDLNLMSNGICSLVVTVTFYKNMFLLTKHQIQVQVLLTLMSLHNVFNNCFKFGSQGMHFCNGSFHVIAVIAKTTLAL